MRWWAPKNVLSIGSPLRNQLIVGRGTPSERHTKRPFSSGAKTKSEGFSNQNGAAVRFKHVSCFNILVQWKKKRATCMRVCLTFDPDGYRVLNVADLICGGADVFTRITERGPWDLNHLVKVLHFHGWDHHKVVPVLGPRDTRSRPSMMINKAHKSESNLHRKKQTDTSVAFLKQVTLKTHSHSCSDALQEQFLPLQDHYGAGRACGRQPGGGSLGHRTSCRGNKPERTKSNRVRDNRSRFSASSLRKIGEKSCVRQNTHSPQ